MRTLSFCKVAINRLAEEYGLALTSLQRPRWLQCDFGSLSGGVVPLIEAGVDCYEGHYVGHGVVVERADSLQGTVGFVPS